MLADALVPHSLVSTTHTIRFLKSALCSSVQTGVGITTLSDGSSGNQTVSTWDTAFAALLMTLGDEYLTFHNFKSTAS
ncbi:unnamed protein product [Pieris brassicae]|uniref:Uncharacterized protein n=1 Tax=Pieris brassicae TaxID=7116 RepID=A0A9P0TQY9_PIEBR|nr:unnamed protein product [Pieris brassicae]